jgi:hypothetical protein
MLSAADPPLLLQRGPHPQDGLIPGHAQGVPEAETESDQHNDTFADFLT